MVVGQKAGFEKQSLFLDWNTLVSVVILSPFREPSAQLPVWRGTQPVSYVHKLHP